MPLGSQRRFLKVWPVHVRTSRELAAPTPSVSVDMRQITVPIMAVDIKGE